jgi:hypothetical protein
MLDSRLPSWFKSSGLRCSRFLLRIQPFKLRIAVQKRQVRIAPCPIRILESRFPTLSDGLQGLFFPLELTEDTSGVIKDRGLVRPQGDRETGLAQRILHAVHLCIVAGQKDASPCVFRNLPQVIL